VNVFKCVVEVRGILSFVLSARLTLTQLRLYGKEENFRREKVTS